MQCPGVIHDVQFAVIALREPNSNVKLSQARAEAVVRYLVEKGKVDPHRLVAVGYGPNVPIDTNSTTAGRANNRRVEFVIREINGKKVEPTP